LYRNIQGRILRRPARFTTARADGQNRAGAGLRAAIGVGRDPRDTGAFPTVSFINEGAPEARPIAREGVAWSGRLVASHFAGIGRDSNPRPLASCCVPRFMRQFGLAFRTYHELGAAVLLG